MTDRHAGMTLDWTICLLGFSGLAHRSSLPQSVTWWTCHCLHLQYLSSGRQPQFCQYPKYLLHSLPPTTDPYHLGSSLQKCIVATDYIYPFCQSLTPNLSFLDQFAFQSTASTTVAFINLLHTITTLLQTNHYVIVYALDFSTTVQCSTNICSWKCQTTSIIWSNRFSVTTHTVPVLGMSDLSSRR